MKRGSSEPRNLRFSIIVLDSLAEEPVRERVMGRFGVADGTLLDRPGEALMHDGLHIIGVGHRGRDRVRAAVAGCAMYATVPA